MGLTLIELKFKDISREEAKFIFSILYYHYVDLMMDF